MHERNQLKEKIRKMYLASGEYSFEEYEIDSFLNNSAHYVEDGYHEYGQHKYDSVLGFLYDWKADSIIYGVANKNYDWFL